MTTPKSTPESVRSKPTISGRPRKKWEKHSGTGTPEHRVWWNMVARCTYPSVRNYGDYGGRGIKVCDRWRASFAAFLEDMGPRPTSDHSIERDNNSANYSCGHCDQCRAEGWVSNCRWAERLEQANNKRNNVLITYQGRTLTSIQWSRATGIKRQVIQWRLKEGWSAERILTTPLMTPSECGNSTKRSKKAREAESR